MSAPTLDCTLPVPSDEVARARDRAVAYMRAAQQPEGWWKGHLETNVTMEAEDLMLRQFLGIRRAEQTEETARWIRAKQRDDGSWPVFYGGPGDVSTTIEAYIALRLAGDDTDAEHMAKARGFVLAGGGIEASRVFTRVWLALFGEWSWQDVPAIPPELILLPPRVPLNVYDFASWARGTIVPLAVVSAIQPVRSLGFHVRELRTGRRVATQAQGWSRSGVLDKGDQLVRRYGKRPIRSVRQHALRRCAEWIVARQEADGGWGGIQPPWVYSIIALHLLDYPLEHPVLRAGLDGLEGFTVRQETANGVVRWLEACQSPVWDTALALIGVADAGVPGDDPMITRAVRWVLTEEIRVSGDWSVRRPGVQPSGWAFEFANDSYPDTDDTAEVIMALRRARLDTEGSKELDASIARAVRWLIGMQSHDGGWGAFDADNTRQLVAELPFCDFGEVIDPPSADVTAHIVEALAYEGLASSPPVRRGIAWLTRAQEQDGSWFGRWGANYIYGTGAVVPALVAAGMSRRDPIIQRAVRWLESMQNADGGWGEDLRSYEDPAWRAAGESTASQTAWALLALVAAGEANGEAARRGAEWLAATQCGDGSWDEPYFTGTGFPGDFYIKYHLYRMVFPITALGRYLEATTVASEESVAITTDFSDATTPEPK